MKYRWFWLVVFLIAIMLCHLGMERVHAQSASLTPSVLILPSTAVAANCPLPVAGSTIYCRAADQEKVSANGAAYVVVWPTTATVAGVTSWNGLTGAVTYTPPAPPVTSVNGKTGAVVLGATATAPSVTVQ